MSTLILLGLGFGGLVIWTNTRAYHVGFIAGWNALRAELTHRVYTSPAFHTILEEEQQTDHDPYL